MGFCQCQQPISSMEADEDYRQIPADRRREIRERIENTVFDHILKEIVLYDTKRSLGPRYKVFKLFLTPGDVDMVVFDSDAGSCMLFEITHSENRTPIQYQHLLDQNGCSYIEGRFGMVTGRYVLYRGEDADRNGIRYLNVEDFLRRLPESVKNL